MYAAIENCCNLLKTNLMQILESISQKLSSQHNKDDNQIV